MNRRANKKLARVLTQMREKGLCLIRQPDGSYAARHLGRICARLSADEAKTACANGILIAHADQQLQCSEQVDLWLKRRAIGDPQSAYGAQHRDMHRVHLIDSEGCLFTAYKNATESPLAWLRRHGGKDKAPFLTAPEFAAAEQLRQDYYRSSLAQKLCSDWQAPARGTAAQGPHNAVLDAADNALAAKERFMEALDALGPGLDDLVFCLCIREISLGAIEKARKWPKRTAKVVLKLALDRLARHYGLLH
ncbi:MAG: DUF6456 domain-containing protein [Robiginitomaculum sp.]|nr:DUF6456 domain-containing protein [Robiginitomaculum sp.]MDQ7078054.1 DUF6456 domain-containing protein [Robiginitomaculum sp.]